MNILYISSQSGDRWGVKEKFLLVKFLHLFSLQVSTALNSGRPAPLLGNQVWRVRLGELQVVTLHWGWPWQTNRTHVPQLYTDHPKSVTEHRRKKANSQHAHLSLDSCDCADGSGQGFVSGTAVSAEPWGRRETAPPPFFCCLLTGWRVWARWHLSQPLP